MDEVQMARVAELMARMAEGDGSAPAPFTLQQEFAPSLRSCVRRAASLRGVELPPDAVDEVVGDVVLMLHHHAAGWRPEGGALPWVWAERRVVNLVDRHLGLFTEELDEARIARAERIALRDGASPLSGSGAELPPLRLLESLAQASPSVRTLRQALAHVATERDAELWLEVRVQERLGDRSPAATVARRMGISADSARQQRRRVDQRLRGLLESDPAYAELAEVVGLVPTPELVA